MKFLRRLFQLYSIIDYFGRRRYCRLFGFCDRGRDRLEEWDMKCWMELETEGDLINLSLDGEGTNIAGTQLPARQVETQIPGGESDLISRTIDGGGIPVGISIGHVSPHCLLELDMSWVPNTLAPLEPVVYSWNVGGFFCPGKQRGLVAEYALEQGEAGGGLLEGILCILGPQQEAVPAVLVIMTVGTAYLPISWILIEMNCGPWSETTYSGMPKVRKIWWKRASTVSRAVDKPWRGINLQALENLSTATRIQENPSELGRSVMKLTPTWDHGRRGMGNGNNFPAGKWCGILEMAQTEHPQTYWETSRDKVGNQYRAWRIDRGRWLPGCPEPGEAWREPRRVDLKEVGT